MFPYLFALLFAVQAPASASQDEIKEGLLRAETLYYEAKFVESIQLLAHVNDVLQSKPDRLQDKISTKLQLALANIGLNDTASAKTFLSEIYALDADYVIDAKQFSPKVIALATDAKNEQNKIRCQQAADDTRNNLAAGDASGILNLLRSMKPKCPDLAAFEPEAAELLYKAGLASYKQNDFSGALTSFRSALKLNPKHELATQYAELAESKQQIAGDRLLLQWQKNFEARQYKDAAADYKQIASLGDSANNQMLTRVTTEYRKALVPLVESFSKSCSAQIRSQINELIPEPTFAEDLRSKMADCVVPNAPAAATPASAPSAAAPKSARSEPKPDLPSSKENVAGTTTAASGCIAMDSQLALLRLKTRVDPEIPREARAYIQNSQVAVRLKTRIDPAGNVSVLETSGTNVILNNSVRTAVERWKFTPTQDANGPRCVDTEILVMIGK
jgi:tetratricopeptide (TPR) repeat protein